MSDIYYTKYLKYKQKYSNLKGMSQDGGDQDGGAEASLCIKKCGRIANYWDTSQPFKTCCSLCNGSNDSKSHTTACNNDHAVTTYKTLIEIILKDSAIRSGHNYHITTILLNQGIPIRLINIIASKIKELMATPPYSKPLTLNLEPNLWDKKSVRIQTGTDFYNLQQDVAKIIVNTLKACSAENFIDTDKYKPNGIPPPHICVKGVATEITRLSGKKYGYDIKFTPK